MGIYSHFSANGINLKDFPFRSEAVMEAYLYENSSILNLEGYEDASIQRLQYPWKKGDGDGRIDLLASYGADFLAVIELKNEPLRERDLEQLKSYFKNDIHLQNQKELLKTNPDAELEWGGILVCTGLSNALLLSYLKDEFKTEKGIPIGIIVIKRFSGDGQSFINTTSYLPKFYRRSPSYKFLGESYNTSRLTHALVKKYVGDNDEVTYSELERKLSGFKTKKPVIALYEKAIDQEAAGSKNYYTKPDEVITLKDGSKVVVLSWWYCNEINTIRDIAKSLNCPEPI